MTIRQSPEVTVAYRRNKAAHPLIPEEVEGPGNYSSGISEYLTAAEFSPDAQTLVGAVRFEWECGFLGTVAKQVNECHLVAWNSSTGKEVWKQFADSKMIKAILFSPDGKTLTVVDPDGISLLDAATGRETRRWQAKDPLFSACYSPDRNWLATGSKDEVLLWEVATGRVRRRLALPGKDIKAIAYSPDGKWLAAGGDKTIRLWDALTGKVHGDCSAFPNPVETVAFASDSKTLFSGHGQEHIVRRWDVETRKPCGEITGPLTPFRMLSFSADSRKILGSSAEDELHLWETATGKPCPLPPNDSQLLTDFLPPAGRSALLRCEVSFGRELASLLTGKVDLLDQVPGFIGVSVDRQRLLVATEKDQLPCLTVLKTAKLKDKAKRRDEVECEYVWKHSSELRAALSPDGKTIAAAGDAIVCFFDVNTGRERRYEYRAKVQQPFLPQSVKFSADGSRLAVVGDEGAIRIFDVHDGRRSAEWELKARNVDSLAFSPDGQTLLTTSLNGPTCVWEVATGQMVRRLKARAYLVSPDNRLLAESADTLKLLDLYTGRVLRECKAEGHALGDFAFSPNSRFFAASCSDTTILVWPSTAAVAQAGKPWDEKSLALPLEHGDATEAYEAIDRLLADPDRALAFLERRLQAARNLDAEQVQRLLADLDVANRRETATKELAQLGSLIEPALRTALAAATVPLASKARIEKLLQALDENPTAIAAPDLLHVRAVQALERIGTSRARQLLERVAAGAVSSPRTRAALQALKRMQAR